MMPQISTGLDRCSAGQEGSERGGGQVDGLPLCLLLDAQVE
jgi:hypothetical protein